MLRKRAGMRRSRLANRYASPKRWPERAKTPAISIASPVVHRQKWIVVERGENDGFLAGLEPRNDVG